MTKGQPRRIAVVRAGLIASAGRLITALASTERFCGTVQDAKVRPDEYIPPTTIKDTGRRHHLVGRTSSRLFLGSASVTDISEVGPAIGGGRDTYPRHCADLSISASGRLHVGRTQR
jgi:hypothetical protein